MAKRNGSTPSKHKESTALQIGNGDVSELLETTPFGLMRRFSEEMDRLFGGTLASRATDLVGGRWSPPVEMFERDNNLVVRADLPGMTKDDVKLELTDDGISIEGERRDESEAHGQGFYRSERTYGKFYRRIPLPEGVRADDASATFSNGVLEVTMPAAKREQRKARHLEIHVEAQPKAKRKAA
jgi:HSP20 family protein